MDPVQQLLADLQAGTIADADALNARLADLTDEQVGEFEALTTELFDAIVDGTAELEEGADRLEVLETLANAVDATRAEAGNRYEAATAEAERIAAVAERVHGPVAEQAEEQTAEGAEPEGADEGDGQAEGEPVEQEAQAPEGEQAEERQPEPVAAAARPRIGRVAARRPVEQRPASSNERRTVITAAAEIPGYAAGQAIPDIDALTEALSARADGIRRVNVAEGSEVSYHVATIRADYPDDQDLRQVQHNAEAVEQLVTAAIGRRGERYESLTAAGGWCAPAVPLYDQITIADASRPGRDSLPAFQAGRGRVIYMASPNWTGYSSGVRKWTSTNDTEALTNSNVRKPCVRVDCGNETTAEVYAIPVCVTVGNFYDRTYDERRTAILEDVMAWQARFAERELLSAIADASTTVTTGQTLGTARDILAMLDRAISGFRSRFRVADSFRLEYWAPRWLRDNIRADLTRAIPASGSTLEENLAVADATIEAFFRARGVNTTWLMDGERGGTDQEFGAEAGGSLQNWPTRVIQYLFHPGEHRFLDGGELNIGIVRDSTLNATNDLQIWSETFEGLMSPGLESLRIDSDICPSGEISGTTDVTGSLCTVGS